MYEQNDFSDYEEWMLVEEEEDSDNRDLAWDEAYYADDPEAYDVPFV